MKKRYYLKDLERILKVGRTLIYYWEARGKIPKAKRTVMGNYRYWSERDVGKIKKIVEGGR